MRRFVLDRRLLYTRETD